MAGMVGLGLWLGRGTRDVAEYAVGGRNLPWWLILFSILATETSSVTFLGSHGVDQLMVQRYLSARGLPEARRAVWVSGLIVVAQFALFDRSY
jgi:hypothetical protein